MAAHSQGGAKGEGVPPINGTTKTRASSIRAQSRFASVVLDAVLRPPRLAGTHDHVLDSLQLRKQRTRESRAFEGRCASSDRDEGVAGRNGGESMIFLPIWPP